MARLLLDAGANVNAKLTDGSTPLALAAWKGHAEVVRMVLARGANYRVRLQILGFDESDLGLWQFRLGLWMRFPFMPGNLHATADLCTE